MHGICLPRKERKNKRKVLSYFAQILLWAGFNSGFYGNISTYRLVKYRKDPLPKNFSPFFPNAKMKKWKVNFSTLRYTLFTLGSLPIFFRGPPILLKTFYVFGK
jgi:hypothetical protein